MEKKEAVARVNAAYWKNVFSQKTQWVSGGGEAEDDQEDGRAWATSLQLDEESWQAKNAAGHKFSRDAKDRSSYKSPAWHWNPPPLCNKV